MRVLRQQADPQLPAVRRDESVWLPVLRGCGAQLEGAAEAQPPREERRVVTVIFVDLVGFTARAERLDPEDVKAMLTPYYTSLREQIESFGGTVEKFIGMP